MSESLISSDEFLSCADVCPRCHVEGLRAWHELSDSEQEFVARLPAATHTRQAVRVLRHRWCRNCWYEESRPTEPLLA